jgi:hypothetical protein
MAEGGEGVKRVRNWPSCTLLEDKAASCSVGFENFSADCVL